MWSKAVVGLVQISTLYIAGLGQEQSFAQTTIGREFASFTKVIASIEDPMVIRKILAHLDEMQQLDCCRIASRLTIIPLSASRSSMSL
jgi:hypothetical protein